MQFHFELFISPTCLSYSENIGNLTAGGGCLVAAIDKSDMQAIGLR